MAASHLTVTVESPTAAARAEINTWSTKKGLQSWGSPQHKEDVLEEPDAEPHRQLSSHSTLSEDLQVELEEVKRQLSQAQEAATEAFRRTTTPAKTTEAKLTKEALQDREQKVARRRSVEELQRKRRFAEAKAKAEALEMRKGATMTSSTLLVPLPRSSPGKSKPLAQSPNAQSPKGIRTVFKFKRENSRQRQEEAVKLAAEQRKKELAVILKQEGAPAERSESVGTLQARLSSAEACKELLEVQLANMAAHAERLAFEREDLLGRLVAKSAEETSLAVLVKPSRVISERSLRRLRRTTGFTFMVIVCMALFAYIKAFHYLGHLGHELPPQPPARTWLRR